MHFAALNVKNTYLFFVLCRFSRTYLRFLQGWAIAKKIAIQLRLLTLATGDFSNRDCSRRSLKKWGKMSLFLQFAE